MAKTGRTTKARMPSIPEAPTVVTPGAMAEEFLVKDSTPIEEIVLKDGTPTVTLKFDYVYFKKLSDDFVAKMRPENQKAYWLAFAEYDDRSRKANIALHEIGVDPIQRLLDGPRGSANPLVKAITQVQAIAGKDWYITSRVAGGEGDYESALQAGFRPIRHPSKDKGETLEKTPWQDWSGDIWSIPDGSVSAQGEQIFSILVYVRAQAQKDHNDAMAMISHNKYSQNKQLFYDNASNISRDMLGSKERLLPASDVREKNWDQEEQFEEQYHPPVRRK